MKNKVIVLIPHFNDPEGLYKSLRSINAEEKTDILIIDDGSESKKIDERKALAAFNANGNVFFHYLGNNCGIETALNTGLEWIIKNSYEYAARLDCGDINIGSRFNKQREFFEKNKKVYLLGTWGKVVDEQGNKLYNLCFPIDHERLRKRIFLQNPFIHPSIMFRVKALHEVGLYPNIYPAAEDYAFFFKIVKKYEVANLPEFLIQYEINVNSISSRKRKEQVKSRIKVIKDNFYFGYHPIAGILRNLILLNFSRKRLEKLKKGINWKAK